MARIPKPAIPAIRWPAVMAGPGARILAQQYQYRRTERWDPERMRAHQFAQLGHLIAHAERAMPFWRQRLRDAGIDPSVPLTEEIWSRIPVLTRSELQDAGPALHCLNVPPSHGELSRANTSGSSGRPVNVLKTDLHHEYWEANLLRELLWMQADLRGKIAIVRRNSHGGAKPGQGTRLADWDDPINKVFPTGPAVIYDIQRPIAEQAEWLLREDPDYLFTFPSVLGLLAGYFRETGKKPKRLRGLRTFAEIVTPDLRALCRDVFGLGITDCYSCEEVGYVALQCPRHEHLHVLSEGVLLEVLDDANRPCAPGQVGRVIVTPPHNFAMPLLRYELGDWAEPGPPCDCGRTLPVLRRIIGRTRNRVLLPNGEIRAAYFGRSGFGSITALRQFQVIQISRTAIEILLVVREPLPPEEEAAIVQRIHEMLGHPFESRVTYVDEIPRMQSGKSEDFKSLIL